MAALLIDHGAVVDKANKNGTTPLHAAAWVSINIFDSRRSCNVYSLVCSLLYFMVRLTCGGKNTVPQHNDGNAD